MASATIKKTCAKCSKGGGTAMCYGCEHAFCTKHFIEHRQELSQQMDNISQEHDLLQRDLIPEQSTHSLLARIDQWEQESITQIQQAAAIARTDLQKLLDTAKNNLKTSVSKMTTELQSSRESDDYTEKDITKWTEQLIEARKMLDNPTTVNLDYDDDTQSVIRLIKASDQPTSNISSHTSLMYQETDCTASKLLDSPQEKFDEISGEVELSEDCLTATAQGARFARSCVSGIGRYSSGTHHIHIRIEQKTVDHYFFFGIVTASQQMTKNVYNSTSAYGWWDLESPVVNGKISKDAGTKTVRKGDEMILMLDCDNRRIQLEHHRTNMVRLIPIDLQHCPFPWKITVSLYAEDDCVRILH